MYSQLVEGYVAGASYEVIFNYPQIDDNPYGLLTNEHFMAMEKFYNNTQTLNVNNQAQAAFAMPHDYGWGMRSTQDMIWGLWTPDATSLQIWNDTRKLLNQYGSSLDIVYDDARFPLQGKYAQLYFWNQTL